MKHQMYIVSESLYGGVELEAASKCNSVNVCSARSFKTGSKSNKPSNIDFCIRLMTRHILYSALCHMI